MSADIVNIKPKIQVISNLDQPVPNGPKKVDDFRNVNIAPSYIVMRYLTCVCGETFFDEDKLNVHFCRTSHNGIKRDISTYQCNHCTKAFDTESRVLQHHKMAHQISYSNKRALQERRTYLIKDGAGFVCKHCGKVLKSKTSLYIHERIHTGIRKYKCDQCDRAFLNNQGLQVHLNVHSGARPFACDECPMAFGSISNLKRHILLHKGIKPFTCEACPRRFASNAEQKLHYKTVHLKIPLPYKRKPRGTGRPRMTVTNYHKFLKRPDDEDSGY